MNNQYKSHKKIKKQMKRSNHSSRQQLTEAPPCETKLLEKNLLLLAHSISVLTAVLEWLGLRQHQLSSSVLVRDSSYQCQLLPCPDLVPWEQSQMLPQFFDSFSAL
jgi:predicted alpha/beta hydrolase family esterase